MRKLVFSDWFLELIKLRKENPDLDAIYKNGKRIGISTRSKHPKIRELEAKWHANEPVAQIVDQ